MKHIKLEPETLEYVRNCISADIEYRKQHNYMPEVDDLLEIKGKRIIKKLEKAMDFNIRTELELPV